MIIFRITNDRLKWGRWSPCQSKQSKGGVAHIVATMASLFAYLAIKMVLFMETRLTSVRRASSKPRALWPSTLTRCFPKFSQRQICRKLCHSSRLVGSSALIVGEVYQMEGKHQSWRKIKLSSQSRKIPCRWKISSDKGVALRCDLHPKTS